MNKFNINDIVMTPDGKGIVKKIEELYSNEIGYTCLLEKPYRIENPYGEKIYGFDKYLFGYMYNEKDIMKVI